MELYFSFLLGRVSVNIFYSNNLWHILYNLDKFLDLVSFNHINNLLFKELS